ncbi:hypothetical protein [Actinophytocola sp.]|nr:hypothetical protein [Actinophytocola sp.]HET9143024.1 hypothetical protein [Actinophytocola sp.]
MAVKPAGDGVVKGSEKDLMLGGQPDGTVSNVRESVGRVSVLVLFEG